jgi:hypothetical protein
MRILLDDRRTIEAGMSRVLHCATYLKDRQIIDLLMNAMKV